MSEPTLLLVFPRNVLQIIPVKRYWEIGRIVLHLSCCQSCRAERERPGHCRNQYLHEFCFHILVNTSLCRKLSADSSHSLWQCRKICSKPEAGSYRRYLCSYILEISPTFKQHLRFSFHSHEQLLVFWNPKNSTLFDSCCIVKCFSMVVLQHLYFWKRLVPSGSFLIAGAIPVA